MVCVVCDVHVWCVLCAVYSSLETQCNRVVTGKHSTLAQEYINDHPQYVKVVSPWGHVTHVPWAQKYLLMKQAAGIGAPG